MSCQHYLEILENEYSQSAVLGSSIYSVVQETAFEHTLQVNVCPGLAASGVEGLLIRDYETCSPLFTYYTLPGWEITSVPASCLRAALI